MPPMTLRDGLVVETGRREARRSAGRAPSRRTAPGPRRRSRSRGRRGRRRRRRPRSGSTGRSTPTSSPPQAVGQNPIPSRPPVAAIPRTCASDRLRALSHTPRTPVCDATTGRVAIARTSSMVAADACATSTSIPRASIRRTISRPASVRPPFSSPCADPPNALSKKWLGDIIRKPASATTSTLAGSPSSACAPSIARRPAVSVGSREPRGFVRGQVRACPDDPERAIGASGQAVGARRRGGARGAAGVARSRAASRARWRAG